MRKAGRPSSAPKKLKDGYYMLIIMKNTRSPVRIMRETIEELEQAKQKYHNHEFKYLGQVKDNIWLDGENKGKPTA